MNEIVTTVCGNVATDVKQQVTKTGQLMTTFRLASTARRFDRGLQGFVDQDTTWMNVTCWAGLAQNVAASVHKGQPVVVLGSLRVREWKTDDGRSGKEVDLVAQTVGHDLRRGSASFQKVVRAGHHAGQAVRPVEGETDGDGYDGDGDDCEETSVAGHGDSAENAGPEAAVGSRGLAAAV